MKLTFNSSHNNVCVYKESPIPVTEIVLFTTGHNLLENTSQTYVGRISLYKWSQKKEGQFVVVHKMLA